MDHVTYCVYFNGEFVTCSAYWTSFVSPGIDPGDVLEFHLHNPHSFGNANAYSMLLAAGLLLIAAALFLTGYNLYDGRRAGQAAQLAADRLAALLPAETRPADLPGAVHAPLAETKEIEIPDYILNPDMEMPVVNIDGQDYIGILEIPALELTLPVIGSWSYPSLKLAPCRYEGSAYSGSLIIAGHNYSSHFGQLKNLSEGEMVLFTDMDGNVFTYQVAVRETLPPTAIDEMESGGWDLTLFTCTVGGQSRLTIRCMLAGA